jgi:hypothetical protein
MSAKNVKQSNCLAPQLLIYVLFIITGLLATGCKGEGGGTGGQTLTPSSTSLNFNNVNLGSSSTLIVNFTNAGSSNVTLSNVTISGAGFTTSGVSNGQIITPGQAVTMTVTFAPAATGPVNGSVTVTSDASNSTLSITLSGTGIQGGSGNSSGWTYVQDSLLTFCNSGTSQTACQIQTGEMLPTVAGSVWVLLVQTTNNVNIQSFAGTGSGSWVICNTCKVTVAGRTENIAYNFNGSAGFPGAGGASMTLSGASGSVFGVNFMEILPPPGATASFDVGGANPTTCTGGVSCMAVGLTLTATDVVIEDMHNNNAPSWNSWSAPFHTLPLGEAIALNVAPGAMAAPTIAPSNSGATTFSAIAFKSSLGTFTQPVSLTSIKNFTSSATSCSACVIAIPSTSAGDLLYIEEAGINNDQINSITDGSGDTFTVSPSCRITMVLAGNDALACGWTLSVSAGVTSVTVNMSGNASHQFGVFEVTGAASYALDVIGTATNGSSLNPSGKALTTTGTNDVFFQSIFVPGGTSSGQYMPCCRINGQGLQFYNNQAAAGVLLDVSAPVITPLWVDQQNMASIVSGVAFKAK